MLAGRFLQHTIKNLFRSLCGEGRGAPSNGYCCHMSTSESNQMPGCEQVRKRKYTVAVDGNIGCGKSTLLEYFRKFPAVESLTEPVEQWTNIHGYNGLELLYRDPERWNFTFNNYVMLTRLRLHEHVSTVPVKMMERSLLSTHHIFVKNALKTGKMTEFEYGVLEDWFNALISFDTVKLDLIVYLRVSPEICYERIKSRARKEEETLPFTLLTDLHTLYEDWLTGSSCENRPPVMVIDASTTLPELFEVYENKKSQILFGCV